MIVADTSAVVAALLGGPSSARLAERLSGQVIHVPHAIDTEFFSVVRRMVLRETIGPAQATELLTDYDDLPLTRWMFAADLRSRAFALRETVAAYDASFVVLAESLDCPLLTCDARMARSHGHHARIEVV